jgi:hypothetical protein
MTATITINDIFFLFLFLIISFQRQRRRLPPPAIMPPHNSNYGHPSIGSGFFGEKKNQEITMITFEN